MFEKISDILLLSNLKGKILALKFWSWHLQNVVCLFFKNEI